MHKRTVIYRGSLKSCNYSCSYCPFAKHKMQPSEREKDKRNFMRFCDSIESRAEDFAIGAVFVTPYGEASIHRWYWEGLSHLAGLPEIDRVGIQTNLSFSVEECLQIFGTAGRDKLCVWATFHPEMTSIDDFVSKCHKLIQNHVMVCAGAVGVPQKIQLIRELREKLSPAVYLWVNKMDGLKRNYESDEIEEILEIDPFFKYELEQPNAVPEMCVDRCFVEADGKIHTCNISATKAVNWYDSGKEEIFAPVCSRKRCTCYLAYGGRNDFKPKNVFGSYPVFRIPEKFKAVFFDLDGTLLPAHGRKEARSERETPDGKKLLRGLPDGIRRKLAVLRNICPIFLATSMPVEEVQRRLKNDMDIFQGGIFASGGYLWLKDGQESREKIYPVQIGNRLEVTAFAQSAKAKLITYRKDGIPYKVTMIKSRRCLWEEAECARMEEISADWDYRFFIEGNCMEMVKKGQDKGTGIEELCKWLAIAAEEVLAVGNDREDAAMERVCGAYIHKV